MTCEKKKESETGDTATPRLLGPSLNPSCSFSPRRKGRLRSPRTAIHRPPDVMYTVEQARGGVVHTPGFTANGPSPHLGPTWGITDTARAPPGDITHTRYYPLYMSRLALLI